MKELCNLVDAKLNYVLYVSGWHFVSRLMGKRTYPIYHFNAANSGQ